MSTYKCYGTGVYFPYRISSQRASTINNPSANKVETTALSLCLITVAIIAAPMMENGLVYDELFHLYTLENYGLAELLLSPHGGHLNYSTNFFYFLLHTSMGIEARYYYGLMLLTHMLNVYLLFNILKPFTDNTLSLIALVVIWGTSPFVIGTMEWFATYGVVLMTTCLLWITRDVIKIASRNLEVSLGIQALWVLLLLIAIGSFGFAIGVVLVFPVVLYLLLPKSEANKAVALRFILMWPVLLLVYIGVHLGHDLISERVPLHGIQQSADRNDPLMLFEGLIALLTILSYGIANTFLSFLFYSDTSGPTSPIFSEQGLREIILLCSALGILWMGVMTYAGMRRHEQLAARQAVALVLVVIVSYGVFCGWGALSGRFRDAPGIDPIQQIVAPRYHYFQSALILLATARLFGSKRFASLQYSDTATITLRQVSLTGVVLFTCTALTAYYSYGYARVAKAESPLDIAIDAMMSDILKHPEHSTVFLDNSVSPAFTPKNLNWPGRVGVLIISAADNNIANRRVFFIERDKAFRRALINSNGRRVPSLLVATEDDVNTTRVP